MNTIIKPTIGRKVWFYPNGSHIGEPLAAQPESFDPRQAMDATVVCVWGGRMVNLLVVDHGGTTFAVRSVTLRQPEDPVPKAGWYCEWMPYQANQATKEAAASLAISSATAASTHASDVLYPAIEAAMKELQSLHPEFNYAANRAFNHLHRAFWSECPPPASAAPLRPEIVSTQQTLKDPA